MGEPAGCPGAPVGGHQARNTDRRARGNSARPSGQGPQRSGLWTGSYPKVRRRHEQPALTVPPARPRQQQPRSGTNPPRPAPHQIFTPARPSPGCAGLWGFCGDAGRADQGVSTVAGRAAEEVAAPTVASGRPAPPQAGNGSERGPPCRSVPAGFQQCPELSAQRRRCHRPSRQLRQKRAEVPLRQVAVSRTE